jgi:hypothetical protein
MARFNTKGLAKKEMHPTSWEESLQRHMLLQQRVDELSEC